MLLPAFAFVARSAPYAHSAAFARHDRAHDPSRAADNPGVVAFKYQESRVQQFVNAGSELRLQPEKTQRYVITGRATGRVTEVIVEAGQSHVVSAETESLRVEAFEATAQKSTNPEGGIDFRLTQL